MNLAHAGFISDNIDSGPKDVKHPPVGIRRIHFIADEVIDASFRSNENALTFNMIPATGGG